ncbi:MAG: hypothetical protein KJ709_01995 [Nanoarchaeota archaeon]|nr:hypothetical protein [Nanoarchaeota archaeon]
MASKELPILKQDERGVIYDCCNFNLVVRKKGTISSDHAHKQAETIVLIEGDS